LLINHEPDMEVVAEASCGDDAILCGERPDVDLVIMDLSMPGSSGLQAVRTLRTRRPALKIVVLTRHADQTYLHELLGAGVSGYVLKQSAHRELLHAIRAAANGGQFVDPALTQHLAAPFLGRSLARGPRAAPGITARETMVLKLSAQGHSNKDIARRLGIVVKTVEVHKANAMRKLHLAGRIDLLQFAVLQGWLAE
jgi:DNA-binding NarL/FixJ family response regulator